jgi:hypothetical protein
MEGHVSVAAVTVHTATASAEEAKGFSRGASPHPASHIINGIGRSWRFVI